MISNDKLWNYLNYYLECATFYFQVGLYISDTITLVLSDKDNVRVSFVKSLFDDHWNQIAFSVRRNTVSFYVNCEFNGKLPLPGKIRPFGGQPATVIVGSTGPQELDAFQVSTIIILDMFWWSNEHLQGNQKFTYQV